MNLSFDRKVMLVVRVIYIYIIAISISLTNITLGLYVLSTILNESNAALPKHFVGQIFILKAFLR
jgi:hypothetical protein